MYEHGALKSVEVILRRGVREEAEGIMEGMNQTKYNRCIYANVTRKPPRMTNIY
jgi:Na+/H+-translocating membrane pyrophosphatase